MKNFISIAVLLSLFTSFFGIAQYLILGKVQLATGYILFLYPLAIIIYILFANRLSTLNVILKTKKKILIFLLIFVLISLSTLIFNHNTVSIKLFATAFLVSYFFLIISVILLIWDDITFNNTLFLKCFIVITLISLLIGWIHITYNYPLFVNGIKLIIFPDIFTINLHTIPEGLSASKSYFFFVLILFFIFLLDVTFKKLKANKILTVLACLIILFIIYIILKSNDRISILILTWSIISYFIYRIKPRFLKFMPIIYFIIFSVIIAFFMFNITNFINVKGPLNTKSLAGRYFEWKDAFSKSIENDTVFLFGHGVTQGYSQQNAVKIKQFENLKMFGLNHNDKIRTEEIGWKENPKTVAKIEVQPTSRSYTYQGIVIDNQYISILFQSGILGLLCYICAIIYLLKLSLSITSRKNFSVDKNSFLIALVCVLTAYPAAMILENIGAIFFLSATLILLIHNSTGAKKKKLLER